MEVCFFTQKGRSKAAAKQKQEIANHHKDAFLPA